MSNSYDDALERQRNMNIISVVFCVLSLILVLFGGPFICYNLSANANKSLCYVGYGLILLVFIFCSVIGIYSLYR